MSIRVWLVLVSTLASCAGGAPAAKEPDEMVATPSAPMVVSDAQSTFDAAPFPAPVSAVRTESPFVVVAFGDSHTAGDALTSRLRRQLTKRFGDAGRGLVAMGRPPINHYYQRDIQYGAAGQWTSSVGGARSNVEPFGLTGVRMIAAAPGASAWVSTCDSCDTGGYVSQFVLLVRLHPGGAQLRYRIDEMPWQSYDTNSNLSADRASTWAAVPVVTPTGRHRFTVEHDDLPGRTLELFGVVMQRQPSGSSVDSLGLVGRRLLQLASWDWRVIGPQLALRNPSLVLLQYGTNEADDPDLDLRAVAAGYDRVIAQLRRYAPSASIVIVGPPDMARQATTCLDNNKKRRRKKKLSCAWQTPAVLAEIINMQRQAAARNQVLFFDSLAAMGGANQMDKMVKATPRLAATDRVHFTAAGYEHWSDALLLALEPLLHSYATGAEREHKVEGQN